MRTAKEYIKEVLHIEYPETDTISGDWFEENHLPMVVACSCCEMTMALPSAMIDEDGKVYCTDCAN